MNQTRFVGQISRSRLIIADSGYASTANFDALADLPLLVSVRTTDHHATASPASDDRFPPGHRDMAARLATEPRGNGGWNGLSRH